MTTIQLTFPANRFHATPWGRHVNEGIVEWPPSPYRLLRALFDAWKRKEPDVSEADVEGLLRALAAEPPHYRMPEVTATHTRSYLNSNTLDPTEKSLIFDGFVAMAPGAPLYVTWPNVELSEMQLGLLERLLGALNYLGRSESWVEGRVVAVPGDRGVICAPMGSAETSGEMVPLACPLAPDEYDGKPAWMEAITYSTAQYQKERRNLPPAMRMAPYVRPANAVKLRVPRAARGHAHTEEIRVRLMGIHKKIAGDPARVSQLFSGKDENGEPLKDHRHAFILPLGTDRGRIERIFIYTRFAEGFGNEEIQTILRLTELRGCSSEHPIRVMATWRGKAADTEKWPQSRVVVSTTPFVSGRHWRKGRGEYHDFLADEVRRECRNHGLHSPATVMPLQSNGLFEWVEFRRNRKDEPSRPGYGFRLEFAEPVPAPFSLGYACHYGLGQFAAAL
jgi:CRISPR-associated protein Csb2